MTTKVVSLFDTDPTISPALDEDDEKVLSLSVAAALTVFVQHLVHCKANGDPRARGLVAECAERYKVTSTALLDLQLGLKMDLPFEPAKLGGKKKDVVVEKSKRRLGKLGDFSLGLAVGGAVPFVSDLDTLRSLLLLSRKTSGVLRTPVLRHVLFRLGPKLSSPARVAIWSQILELVSYTQSSCDSTATLLTTSRSSRSWPRQRASRKKSRSSSRSTFTVPSSPSRSLNTSR